MIHRAFKTIFTLYPAVLLQALFGLNQMIMLILGALSAQYILDINLSYLATVPAGLMLLSAFLFTPIARKLIERFNYKKAFFIGGIANMMGAACFALSLYYMNFTFLLLSALLYGVFQSFSGFLRFVAADQSSCCKKERAIAMTVGGGTLAAILAPLFISYTQDLTLPQLYLGTFLTLTALNMVCLIIPVMIQNNDLYLKESKDIEKSYEKINVKMVLKQRNFLAASFAGLTSSAMMHVLIVVMPLAIIGCGLNAMDASLAVQTHAIAMLIPAFITGYLIRKFNTHISIGFGLALLILSCLTLNYASLAAEVIYFQIATVSLGLGWGITYISSGKLLLSCYCSCDKTGIQAANEMVITGGSAVFTMIAGAIYSLKGLEAVMACTLILILFTALLIVRNYKEQEIEKEELAEERI